MYPNARIEARKLLGEGNAGVQRGESGEVKRDRSAEEERGKRRGAKKKREIV